ncbi:MAG: hypothetical protein V4515_00165 [Chloroflexota bacterium]
MPDCLWVLIGLVYVGVAVLATIGAACERDSRGHAADAASGILWPLSLVRAVVVEGWRIVRAG